MKKGKWYLLASLILGLLLFSLSVVGRIPEPLFATDYSTVVLDQNDQYLRVFLNQNEQWIMPDDDRAIPPKLRTAVIHYEDKRFEKHKGIDLLAVFRALYQNIRNRDRVSGASTITMQVARLMQPKDRTIKSKLLEMVQALRIEFKYSKAEILKSYLLHAPYGSNIIGYRAASLRYFGKEPDSLSWAEAATLTVLPNNPANVNPMRNRTRLQEKRDALLLSLFQANLIDNTTYTLALAEPVPEGQHPFPLAAPHLAERVKGSVEGPIIRTTIDKEIQDRTTYLLKDYITALGRQGVNNGAVLITDTVSGQVKAYVASQDYFDNSNLGKIDGVQMRRSSGSTLKPFLYALAMDEGLIIPESVVLDIPVSYGGYTPYNSNYSFDGIVRAEDALIRSLNAPAVNLLSQYGVHRFYSFLKEAGVTSLYRQPDEYGLSLILGGSESSLWELNQLYRGLGNYGVFSDIHVLKKDSDGGEANRLISAGSSYLVLDILKELERPGLEYYWREYQTSSLVAWKTGTSHGNRDAWAVGVSPKWTVAVWVGNFAGGEVKGMAGIDSAAPLLFQLFNQLQTSSDRSWFPRPDYDLTEIAVSEHTGYRLKEGYGQTRAVATAATAKPLRQSPFERVLYLNNDESMQVCSLCWDRDNLRIVPKVIYPPQVSGYLRGAGRDNSLPPHNPECSAVQRTNPITFVYPQQESFIFLPRGTDGEYQKVNLEIAHGYKGSRLFWYIDDEYLGETIGHHQLSISLETGWHRLYVLDGEGNSRSIMFYSERR